MNKRYLGLLILLIAILVVLSVILYLIYTGDINLIQKANQQNIYSLYSSAAQAIATFIALLIAGYAIIYQAMDNIENRDESLKEVHEELKKECHEKIKYLSITTGATILLSLLILWLNGYEMPIIKYLMIITDALIVITIILAIWVLIDIIDPNKIKKAANRLLDENADFKPDDGLDEAIFIKEFIKLEKETRYLFKEFDIPIKRRYNEFYGFRQMIDALFRFECLSSENYARLKTVNEYRNLIVHGHEKKANKKMFNEVKELQKIINKLDSDLKKRFK